MVRYNCEKKLKNKNFSNNISNKIFDKKKCTTELIGAILFLHF